MDFRDKVGLLSKHLAPLIICKLLCLSLQVVLDVRCGSAILSFFAIQAGAKRVYAMESKPMSQFTQVCPSLVELICF